MIEAYSKLSFKKNPSLSGCICSNATGVVLRLHSSLQLAYYGLVHCVLIYVLCMAVISCMSVRLYVCTYVCCHDIGMNSGCTNF